MSNASDFDDSWTLGERSLAYVPGAVAAGIDIAELQGSPNGLGYQLPDDGIYGLATARQLRQFQEHRGLGSTASLVL